MALPSEVRQAIWIVQGMLSPEYLNQHVIHKIVFATQNDLERGYVVKEKNGKNMVQFLGKYSRVPPAECPLASLVNFETQVGVLVECTETGKKWLDISDRDDVLPFDFTHRAIFQTNHKEGCWMCGAEVALKQCGKCMLAKYCGVACQRAHRKIHKTNCDPVQKILG